MIKFIYIFKAKSFLNKIIWKFILSKSFNEYGKNTHLFLPDYIEGDKYITLKNDVYIGYKASIIVLKSEQNKPNLTIGSGTKIRRYSHIVCCREVIIEDKVLIADKVFISDNIHSYQKPEIAVIDQCLDFVGNVRIGSGTCIGENVCIIGAKIGKNCTIGANSVVINDIPDYSIAVGSPARVIKKFDFNEMKWTNNI